jgi:hypothetical protein
VCGRRHPLCIVQVTQYDFTLLHLFISHAHHALHVLIIRAAVPPPLPSAQALAEDGRRLWVGTTSSTIHGYDVGPTAATTSSSSSGQGPGAPPGSVGSGSRGRGSSISSRAFYGSSPAVRLRRHSFDPQEVQEAPSCSSPAVTIPGAPGEAGDLGVLGVCEYVYCMAALATGVAVGGDWCGACWVCWAGGVINGGAGWQPRRLSVDAFCGVSYGAGAVAISAVAVALCASQAGAPPGGPDATEVGSTGSCPVISRSTGLRIDVINQGLYMKI